MVMSALRFRVWNALRLMRLPLCACFTALSLFNLTRIVAGTVTLPFGGAGDSPLWAQLVVIALSVPFFLPLARAGVFL